jgi:hypothetical protein
MTKLLLLVAGLAAALPVTSAMSAEDAGSIKIAKGAVTVQRGGEKIAAKPGERVVIADRIVTGADGSVGIILRDNTLLSAGPNSTLVLERFAFDSTTHTGELDASLKRGTLAVVSGKIAKQSPGAVQFRTPNAILGVRGTEFVIDAGPGEE